MRFQVPKPALAGQLTAPCGASKDDGTQIVKDNRPVNLDIGTMRLPITAWASITHRATGVFLFVGTAVLIWMLDASLRSPESFASLKATLDTVPVKLVLWAILAGAIMGITVTILEALFGLDSPLEDKMGSHASTGAG